MLFLAQGSGFSEVQVGQEQFFPCTGQGNDAAIRAGYETFAAKVHHAFPACAVNPNRVEAVLKGRNAHFPLEDVTGFTRFVGYGCNDDVCPLRGQGTEAFGIMAVITHDEVYASGPGASEEKAVVSRRAVMLFLDMGRPANMLVGCCGD